MKRTAPRPIYLDHQAATPLDERVLDEMLPYLTSEFGNPSSSHAYGRAAARAIGAARRQVADLIGATGEREVVFTSGGTESDNLALQGTFTARRDADPRRTRLLVSTVEHHAVLDCVDFLAAHEGAKVTWLEADGSGGWTELTLATVDDTATLAPTPPTLREGLLKLTGGVDA